MRLAESTETHCITSKTYRLRRTKIHYIAGRRTHCPQTHQCHPRHHWHHPGGGGQHLGHLGQLLRSRADLFLMLF